MKTLRLGPDFTVPLDIVSSAIGILGIRGSGKTTTAGVLVEETIGAGVPCAIVDPTGGWFGLKSSADGKKAGLPVYVFGGEHADVPLEENAGDVIARFIVEQRVPVVLDLSLLRKGAQVRFVGEFLETLYHINREPLLVVLDEVARFCPQTSRGLMSPEIGKCIGAVDDIAALGRRKGLGVVLIGQRGARINKDVLTQCQTLIAMQTAGAPDRKALDEWINEQHGADEHATEFKAALTKLKVGEGFVWSPGFLGVFKRVHFRNRWTFDSSRTPKAGERVITPKAFAEVDLGKLTAELEATKERAKADDPKALRERLRIAEAEIAELRNSAIAAPQIVEERVVEKIVEVPALGPGELERVTELAKALTSWGDHLQRFFVDAATPIVQECTATGRRLEEALACVAAAKSSNNIPESTRAAVTPRAAAIAKAPAVVATRPPRNTDTSPRFKPRNLGNEAVSLGKAGRAILTVLAQHAEPMALDRVAILSGYSVGTGGFNNALGSLRSSGFILRGDPTSITDAGRTALGDFEPLPHGEALRDYWLGRLGKAERAILGVLCKHYPDAIETDELATRAGYAPKTGGFNNALGRLRTLKLAIGYGEVRASEALFE